ncbi:hypothetical protein F9C07_214 [Aspergillus flavus]|uniref:Uncharacterized protein n=1 Tax=Aspergillus flavus (strain ATCC 200026 / FGSC A1120 / IAM 13836 / NRRL 3357 / JCM 12722 / SRRC 167) TaxID=332952 RepID=A0A7U2QWH4_ASPFN|nr:hypothetical protein F9C07_214 [Aspergillus flavus]
MNISTVLAVATTILSGVSAGPLFSEADTTSAICWEACLHQDPIARANGKRCCTCCKERQVLSYDYELFEWEE